MSKRAGIGTVAREWGRLGVVGFGGPPAHIVLLRQLCVERREWISAPEFEDAVAVCNLLPGPASTQLAIYCASRVAGWPGAIVGGAGVHPAGPGGHPWPRGALPLGLRARVGARAGAGGGAAVAAVAVRAGVDLHAPVMARRGGAAAAVGRLPLRGYPGRGLAGPWLVVVLLGCGIVELAVRRGRDISGALAMLAATPSAGGWRALAWTAFKVGGLSYGGGFVIIPLMQADAVSRYHWMTVGPVPRGRRAGADHSGAGGADRGRRRVCGVRRSRRARRRGDRVQPVVHPRAARPAAVRPDPHRLRARAFLEGAGPAAIGAILGAAVPLAGALTEPWQYGVLAAAAVALLVLRRSVMLVLLAAAAIGLVLMWAGATIPG